ncbi:pyrroloquinoline quinone biosynthesis peptide chaperone PqqD [Pseudonocardia parietis]|uniref:Pyrroloquinoline quinone biosynthesis protein D n=1 Tax=Pseudonocardia parietis TaxID=570936 RepID=A0ABS4VTS2_9PSEU|nr:pyrroloquinoline quinone biosynthesis peptide chaperone PqqD [Pseudonocardia parietis]MBP2367321.1 pyrroloquinoline quinone biosynthesis protein D [Pseudonocardia parietis]
MPTRDATGAAAVPGPRRATGGTAQRGTPGGVMREIRGDTRPRLGHHVRMRPDRATGGHVLLGPETVVVLNQTGHAVLRLCDGERTVDQIVASLVDGFEGADEPTVREQVHDYLTRLARRNLVTL